MLATLASKLFFLLIFFFTFPLNAQQILKGKEVDFYTSGIQTLSTGGTFVSDLMENDEFCNSVTVWNCTDGPLSVEILSALDVVGFQTVPSSHSLTMTLTSDRFDELTITSQGSGDILVNGIRDNRDIRVPGQNIITTLLAANCDYLEDEPEPEPIIDTSIDVECDQNTGFWTYFYTETTNGVVTNETTTLSNVLCSQNQPDYETKNRCVGGDLIIETYSIENGIETLIASVDSGNDCYINAPFNVDSLPYIHPVSGYVQDTVAQRLLQQLVNQQPVITTVDIECNQTTNTWHYFYTETLNGIIITENNTDSGVPCSSAQPDYEFRDTCISGNIYTQTVSIVNNVESVIASVNTTISCSDYIKPDTTYSSSPIPYCLNDITYFYTVIHINGVLQPYSLPAGAVEGYCQEGCDTSVFKEYVCDPTVDSTYFYYEKYDCNGDLVFNGFNEQEFFALGKENLGCSLGVFNGISQTETYDSYSITGSGTNNVELRISGFSATLLERAILWDVISSNNSLSCIRFFFPAGEYVFGYNWVDVNSPPSFNPTDDFVIKMDMTVDQFDCFLCNQVNAFQTFGADVTDNVSGSVLMRSIADSRCEYTDAFEKVTPNEIELGACAEKCDTLVKYISSRVSTCINCEPYWVIDYTDGSTEVVAENLGTDNWCVYQEEKYAFRLNGVDNSSNTKFNLDDPSFTNAYADIGVNNWTATDLANALNTFSSNAIPPVVPSGINYSTTIWAADVANNTVYVVSGPIPTSLDLVSIPISLIPQ